MPSAIGTPSDTKIYPEQFFGGMQETLERNINGFNAASGGAITLTTNRKGGYFEEESFIKDMGASALFDRDPDDNGAVDTLEITQDSEVRIKRFWRAGPFDVTHSWFRINKRDPAELSFILGTMQGERVAERMIDDAIRAAASACEGTTDAVVNAGDGNLANTDVADGLVKFGDAGPRLRLLVMHSKPYYDLVKEYVTPATELFMIGAAVVRGGAPPTLDRTQLVTDSSALTLGTAFAAIDSVAADETTGVYKFTATGLGTASTPGQIVTSSGFTTAANNGNFRVLTVVDADNITVDGPLVDEAGDAGNLVAGQVTYRSLLLQGGAVNVDQSEEQDVEMLPVIGGANLRRQWQAQGAHNVGVKGYKFDSSINHPTTAQFGLRANWTRVATDVKSTAGVLLVHR